MKTLIVVTPEGMKIGSIRKVAAYIGVHPFTVGRWIREGDRKVFKKGFEIHLQVEKL
jgi:transposase